MPYIVKKEGDEWAVYTEGDNGEAVGEPHGTHDTEEAAHAQQAALYANETDEKGRPMDDEDESGDEDNKYHDESEDDKEEKNQVEPASVDLDLESSPNPNPNPDPQEKIAEQIAESFAAQFKADPDAELSEIHDNFAIVSDSKNRYWVPYLVDNQNQHNFAPKTLWTLVEQTTWTPGEIKPITRKAAQIAASSGQNTLKAIEVNDDTLRVGNYFILFGGNDLSGFVPGTTLVAIKNRDGSVGERFAKNVDIDSDYLKTGFVYVDFEHGHDPDKVGNDRDTILGYVDAKSIRRDGIGIWGERILNRHHKYMRWLETLIDAGIMGSSTEPVQSAVEKTADGTITRWGLKRDTLTVTPAEARMKNENVLAALKALDITLPEPEPTDDPEGSVSGNGKKKSDGVGSKRLTNKTFEKTITPRGDMSMFTVADILAMDIADEAKAILIEKLNSPVPDAPVAPNSGEGEGITREDVKSLLTEALEEIGIGKKVGAASQRVPFDGAPAPVEPEKPAENNLMKHIYQTKFGEDTPAKAAIMTDLVGPEYQRFLLLQDQAYAKYLRLGDDALSGEERKALKTQVFPQEHIFSFVKGGGSVSEVKTTMIESQGQLGGFAVPPSRQSSIITRSAGLTAVRQAGAMVVTLLNSNSTEFPRYSGGDDRYRGALRGTWGGETATAAERNATLDMVTVAAGIYLYKVPMSQSLVDDAVNLVDLVENDIVVTLAIDEDDAFLTGPGGNMPHGILPGGANSHSLTAINSGDANTLTPTGLKQLKRGLASQYRANGVFVGNSDSFSTVETMTDGNGQYMFPDLSDDDELLMRRVFESEAMPDVAANAFPLLFGDMSGYGIVERLGLTIQRFQDSNTGLGKVEYHVRRRIGGNILRPWNFVVQKVAA
jgi:HK97 family phage major capsid protein